MDIMKCDACLGGFSGEWVEGRFETMVMGAKSG